MILWFSVAAKKASQSVNLFSLSIPAMCLPGVQDEFSAKSIVCFQSGVLCFSCIISMGPPLLLMVLEFFGESYWGVSGDKAAVLAVFWYGGGVGLIVSYFWRSGFDFLNWVFLIICRRMWGKLFNFFMEY